MRDRQMTHLAKVPGIDVAPGITLAGLGLADVLREIPFILMRLDDIADDEGVDVVPETAGKGAAGALATELGACVRVHRVAVVGVFVEREGVV